MKFNKAKFINEAISGTERKALPLSALAAVKPEIGTLAEILHNAELQYKCLQSLYDKYPAAAIFGFMDLSLEAEALGCQTSFAENEHPQVHNLENFEELRLVNPSKTRCNEMLKCTKFAAENFQCPFFACVTGPFSLAGRIVGINEIMLLVLTESEKIHQFLEKVTEFLITYIAELKSCGAAGVLLAEPLAGLLSPSMCSEFSSKYVKKICQVVKDSSFMIILHNCSKIEKHLEALLDCSADALHLGNAVQMQEILAEVPKNFPLMGNIDPVGVLQNATAKEVYDKTWQLLQETTAFPNFILSSACDLPLGVPEENLQSFFQALEDFNNKN